MRLTEDCSASNWAKFATNRLKFNVYKSPASNPVTQYWSISTRVVYFRLDNISFNSGQVGKLFFIEGPVETNSFGLVVDYGGSGFSLNKVQNIVKIKQNYAFKLILYFFFVVIPLKMDLFNLISCFALRFGLSSDFQVRVGCYQIPSPCKTLVWITIKDCNKQE